MLKNKEPQSDYEHLTEEEWAETVRRHVDCRTSGSVRSG